MAAPTQQKQMRVSVKTSARDPHLFIARPLAEGQESPPGTREAYLVLVEPTGGETAGAVATPGTGAP